MGETRNWLIMLLETAAELECGPRSVCHWLERGGHKERRGGKEGSEGEDALHP